MLHLDAHERLVASRVVAERVDQLVRKLARELEPERRRLERHVAAQLLLAQRREQLGVLARERPRGRLAAHRLAEDRHARGQVALVDRADHRERLLEPLAGEIARRHAADDRARHARQRRDDRPVDQRAHRRGESGVWRNMPFESDWPPSTVMQSPVM